MHVPVALVQPAGPGARAPGQGGIAPPGSLAATPVEAPVDVEEGLPVEIPLVYFYGHVSPADNPELYRFLVERLAALLDKRAEARAPARRPCPAQQVRGSVHFAVACLPAGVACHAAKVARRAAPRRPACSRRRTRCACEAVPGARSPFVRRSARELVRGAGVALCPSIICRAACRRSRCEGAQANAEVRAAGMVVNTMGWVDGLGYELLLHAIAALRADVVLVVGQDRLFSQLSSELRCARAGPGGDTPQTYEWCSMAVAHPLGYGSSARRSCSSVCTYYSQRGLVQLASD